MSQFGKFYSEARATALDRVEAAASKVGDAVRQGRVNIKLECSRDYAVEVFDGGRAVARFGIWEVGFVVPHECGRKVGAYWNVHLPGQSDRARPAPTPEIALDRLKALVEEWLREARLVGMGR